MNKKNHGFTLIELMVTLAVLGVLAAIAAPSFTAFTDSSRRAGQVNLFSGALSYTRNEAITRNSTVSLCARTSTVNAETCSANDNDWLNGWMVFDDPEADGVLGINDTLLRLFEPIATGSTIEATSVAGKKALTYKGSGFLTVASAEYKYCGNRGAIDARAIMINRTGRARLSTDGADSGKIHEDGAGVDLTCP